jgi:hypothetical protein
MVMQMHVKIVLFRPRTPRNAFGHILLRIFLVILSIVDHSIPVAWSGTEVGSLGRLEYGSAAFYKSPATSSEGVL